MTSKQFTSKVKISSWHKSIFQGKHNIIEALAEFTFESETAEKAAAYRSKYTASAEIR